jgi:hypothetical protein
MLTNLILITERNGVTNESEKLLLRHENEREPEKRFKSPFRIIEL